MHDRKVCGVDLAKLFKALWFFFMLSVFHFYKFKLNPMTFSSQFSSFPPAKHPPPTPIFVFIYNNKNQPKGNKMTEKGVNNNTNNKSSNDNNGKQNEYKIMKILFLRFFLFPFFVFLSIFFQFFFFLKKFFLGWMPRPSSSY